MANVSDRILQRLVEEGVRHIFMLPGGGAMHLNDAIARESRITPVPCHHEQACGIAAEAYGRTGHPDNPGFGVALVTTGPGATNLITPVAGAWIESLPLLIISGQVKRPDRLSGRSLRQSGVQEVDVIPMVKGITKFAVTLDDPSLVDNILTQAFSLMRDKRPGPVWIEVPLDVQALSYNPNSQHLSLGPDRLTKSQIPNTDHFFRLLYASKRPLILAGHGVRLAGAAQLFRELISTLKIPVVSTWNALDLLPFNDPLFVGTPGVVALRGPNFAIQNCDLLISIGCRLDNVITAYNPENFARHATKIIVDVDPNELSKHNFAISEPVCSDAHSFISALLQSPSLKPCIVDDWILQCSTWKDKYSISRTLPSLPTDSISHYECVNALSKAIPSDSLIVTGSSGLAIEAFYSTFQVKHNQRLFLTSGLGSMGYGLAASIGACLGNASQPVVAIESDGSLMLNIQELATLKTLSLPIKLIILDNNGYASIRNTQRNYFNGRYIASSFDSGLQIPDLNVLSNAFGLSSMVISDQSRLELELNQFFRHSGSGICIIKLNSEESLTPKVSAVPQPDGSMISMPLEDMTPLLDMETLSSEMINPISDASRLARSHSNSSAI